MCVCVYAHTHTHTYTCVYVCVFYLNTHTRTHTHVLCVCVQKEGVMTGGPIYGECLIGSLGGSGDLGNQCSGAEGIKGLEVG